jgi:hypothetical protein
MEEKEEEVPGDVEGPMIPGSVGRTAKNPTPESVADQTPIKEAQGARVCEHK